MSTAESQLTAIESHIASIEQRISELELTVSETERREGNTVPAARLLLAARQTRSMLLRRWEAVQCKLAAADADVQRGIDQ